MTTSNDRLDRVETILEQFITASVADRQASNERMTRLEQSMTASDKRMKAMDEKTDARFNQLAEQQERMIAEADANREITFGMLDQMMTLQEETKQILEYLFGLQLGNGRGDTPQP